MKVDYLATKGAHLFEDEREFLRSQATINHLSVSTPVFVNIGVAFGASVHCLRAGSSRAKIYGIDIEPFKMVNGDAGSIFLRGNSGDAKIAAKVQEPINLLFIDGGHDYEIVLRDIALWAPKVVTGGTMIFHDYSRSWLDVSKAVQHWYSDSASKEAWQEIPAPNSLKAFQRR